MSQTPHNRDLRERMQRVAAKHPKTAAAAVEQKRGRQRVVPAPQRAVRESRIDTLRAWGRWELTDVPLRRWAWLTAVVRGQTD